MIMEKCNWDVIKVNYAVYEIPIICDFAIAQLHHRILTDLKESES